MNKVIAAEGAQSKSRARLSSGSVIGSSFPQDSLAVPSGRGEISEAIDTLHTRLDILSQQLNILEDKLTPVSRSTVSAKGEIPSQNPCSTQIGSGISGARLRVEVLSQQVSQIIEALDI